VAGVLAGLLELLDLDGEVFFRLLGRGLGLVGVGLELVALARRAEPHDHERDDHKEADRKGPERHPTLACPEHVILRWTSPTCDAEPRVEEPVLVPRGLSGV